VALLCWYKTGSAEGWFVNNSSVSISAFLLLLYQFPWVGASAESLVSQPQLELSIGSQFLFCFSDTGAWTQGLHLKPLHQPYFVGFFKIGHRVSRTICLDRLRTSILLISASWVTRIIGMSHMCLAQFLFLIAQMLKFFLPLNKDKWQPPGPSYSSPNHAS
jgi:hypothetical protein